MALFPFLLAVAAAGPGARGAGGDGAMEVYFDKLDKPFMTAHDTTFTWGREGLGTFDDNGNWDDFELRGVKVDSAAAK